MFTLVKIDKSALLMRGQINCNFFAFSSQQGFGVLSVALASQALTMMSALLDDLQVEVSQDLRAQDLDSTGSGEPASLDILGHYSALQRASKFLGAAPLNQLLFYLATISYRKVSNGNLFCIIYDGSNI